MFCRWSETRRRHSRVVAAGLKMVGGTPAGAEKNLFEQLPCRGPLVFAILDVCDYSLLQKHLFLYAFSLPGI